MCQVACTFVVRLYILALTALGLLGAPSMDAAAMCAVQDVKDETGAVFQR
jgi:hypothetical protein